MRGNSNKQPEAILQTGNTFQVRWNIKRNDREPINDGEMPVESWDFDCVNCKKLDRSSIIQAIIREKYPVIDDEIAIINNKEANPEEYTIYQEYRAFAKKIASETV